MSIPSIVYKAHATGNDFVVYADPDGRYEPTADEVRFLCDRHFGIGGDGLIRLTKPCLLYTSPSPRDATLSRMPSSA